MTQGVTAINSLIHNRRSLRAYSPSEEVSDNDLMSLFEAARWAPSAFNEQPWRFIYARKGSEAYDKLFASLAPGNQGWVQNAPVLVMAVVKLNSSHNETFNRHAMHDLGLAMGMLSIQATDLGLNLHQMGGFNQLEAEKVFNIPSGYEAVTITAVGYAGSPSQLPDGLAEKETSPRNRKKLSEIVFEDSWK